MTLWNDCENCWHRLLDVQRFTNAADRGPFEIPESRVSVHEYFSRFSLRHFTKLCSEGVDAILFCSRQLRFIKRLAEMKMSSNAISRGCQTRRYLGFVNGRLVQFGQVNGRDEDCRKWHLETCLRILVTCQLVLAGFEHSTRPRSWFSNLVSVCAGR